MKPSTPQPNINQQKFISIHNLGVHPSCAKMHIHVEKMLMDEQKKTCLYIPFSQHKE